MIVLLKFWIKDDGWLLVADIKSYSW
jgi:hypothetical protein